MRKALTLAVAGLCAASVPAMAETTGNSVTGSAGASASTYMSGSSGSGSGSN